MNLNEAYNILESCSAVIIDDGTLVYPSLADLTGEDDNEFMYLGWTDDEGREYRVKFTEGPNQQVEAFGSIMRLIDDEGDKIHLTLLAPWQFAEEL